LDQSFESNKSFFRDFKNILFSKQKFFKMKKNTPNSAPDIGYWSFTWESTILPSILPDWTPYPWF